MASTPSVIETVVTPNTGRRALISPVLCVFLLFAVAFGFYYRQILGANSGTFVYALDDTYIHLALAKNLAHGFYGATQFEHSSPSSSVIWPFLLAGVFRLIGVNQMVPLWLQLPICFGILYASARVLRRAGIRNPATETLVLLLIAGLTPFLSLTFVAMEHLLHCLAMIVFCGTFTTAMLTQEETGRHRITVALCAALLSASRYEGLFTLAVAGLLALLARRWKLAIALGTGGGLPVAAFGLYSIHLGGHLLPNSLLVKGQPFSWQVAGRLIEMLKACPSVFAYVWMAMVVLIAAAVRKDRISPMTRMFSALLLGTALLHAVFARWGWYYRYEAYLICFGLLTMALAIHDVIRVAKAPILKLGLLLPVMAAVLFSFTRASAATHMIPNASHATYDQEYQMAKFFARYYDGRAVAVNDVGAVDFFSTANTQDVVGLTSYEILKMRGNASTSDLQSLLTAKHVEVIAIYVNWVLPAGEKRLPEEWVPVELWVTSQSGLLGSNTVSFFGEGCENARTLGARLAEFDRSLPAETKILRISRICGEDLRH